MGGGSDNWYNEDTPTSTTQRVLAYNPLLYNHTIHYSIYVSFVGILVGFQFFIYPNRGGSRILAA